MVEKTQQELITLKGKLQQTIILKTSVNNDEYYSARLEIIETEANGQVMENETDSVMLIFWKKNFNEKTQTLISELKENQNVIVQGYFSGRDNGLFRVIELIETEEDVFI